MSGGVPRNLFINEVGIALYAELGDIGFPVIEYLVQSGTCIDLATQTRRAGKDIERQLLPVEAL